MSKQVVMFIVLSAVAFIAYPMNGFRRTADRVLKNRWSRCDAPRIGRRQKNKARTIDFLRGRGCPALF
jgi:hypothetical protein